MGKFQLFGKSQGPPRGFGEQENLAIYFEGTWDIFGINLRDFDKKQLTQRKIEIFKGTF